MKHEKKLRIILLLDLVALFLGPWLNLVIHSGMEGRLYWTLRSLLMLTASGLFAVLGYMAFSREHRRQTVVFGLVALVFSPLNFIPLPSMIWSLFIVVAIVIVALTTRRDPKARTDISTGATGPPSARVSGVLSFGVFVGPVLGIFYCIVILTVSLGLDPGWIPPSFGIVSTIGLLGSATLSLFINLWVIGDFRSHGAEVPRRFIASLAYYVIPVLVIVDALSEPYVDIGSSLGLMFILLGGGVAVVVGLAAAALLVMVAGGRNTDR